MKQNKVKNSTKLFFSGVVVLTVANLLVKAIGLLFKIPMNKVVGDTGMGYYTSAYTIYTFFYMISTSGLPIAVSILISESRTKGQLRQIKKIFRTTVALFFAIGLVGMLAMIFGADSFASMLKASPTSACIMAIAPTLFFICISSALRGYFQGFQQMVPTAVSELIEALCKLAVGIVLALYAIDQNYPIHIVAAYAAFGLTIGAGLGMIFLCISKLLFKETRYTAEFVEIAGVSDETTPTSKILARLVKVALPITISASVMSLTNMIDMVIVQRLLQETGMSQLEATTVYGNYTTLAVPMFNLPPVLVYPISAAIIPLLSVAHSQGDKKRTRTIMESALRVAVLIGVPCAFGMSALARPILSLFFRVESSVEMAYPLLRLLAPSSLFVCILSITNAILQACGKERKPVISMLCGAVVKVVSNYFLIQIIGMRGTPISTFLCYLTVTCLNFRFVSKYADIFPNIRRVFLRPFICGLLCAATALGSYALVSRFTGNTVSTLVAIACAGIVYLFLIFFTGAVVAEDVRLLPKGDKISAALGRAHLLRD